jgi:hypothetical protein
MARQFRETPQTDHGGRMSKQNDMLVDLRNARSTLDLAIERVQSMTAETSRVARRRVWSPIESDLSLVVRTVESVRGRGGR